MFNPQTYSTERIAAGLTALEEGKLTYTEQPDKGTGTRCWSITVDKETGIKRYSVMFIPTGGFMCSCAAGVFGSKERQSALVPCYHAGAVTKEINNDRA